MASKHYNSKDSGYAETFVSKDVEFSKEQQDIALASLIMQRGLLTERQLSKSLSNWTIYGNVTLADHLKKQNLLDAPTLDLLSAEAAVFLTETAEGLDDAAVASGKSALMSTLNAVDPTGIITRLMGIRTVVGAGAVDAKGDRNASVRFSLIRKIGQGGLGRVWLAFDENLKRYVCLKEIIANDNPTAVQRFQREAEITGRLEHPGIVPVYQLGHDTQTGELFYAMRFLGKTTLHDAIMEYHERRTEGDDDPMLIRRLLMDFISVCQAVGHAHSRKVIHRDLKPENIAIDSFGQVIVIDWGLAKVVDEYNVSDNYAQLSGVSGSHNSTMQGQVLGTPLYMPPEQAAGRIDELDERTDIYGLGAILYAILTGVAPHEKTRDNSQAISARELLAAIAEQPTPDAQATNEDVDPALAAICTKAMARRQYARYESASELAEDVQRWMAGESVTAYQENFSQRITRWIQHHRITSQVIAALMIVSVVMLATWAIASRQNKLAARQVLFDEMRAYEREIKTHLLNNAGELAKNARFMSTLPPIQGLIDAKSGIEGNEGEDVWRGRLETIYEGLLRANPDYLSITYSAKDELNESVNLVRVERNLNDMAYVRRVPLSRLGPFDNAEILQSTLKLQPGDILLKLHRPILANQNVQRDVRLFASTPVFDEVTGEMFGIVAVEINLLNRLVELLERFEQRHARIFVTDSQGLIWVHDHPEHGVDFGLSDRNISQIIPATAEFFSVETQNKVQDRNKGFLAGKVFLDPARPQTNVGIVLQLEQSQ